MVKTSKKILSVILTVAILLPSILINAGAVESVSPLNDERDEIVEVESLREEYVKHFQMPDDSYTAISYTAPVHRKDANGNWVDIDNRMKETISKNKQAYVTSDGRMIFSKKINESDNVIFNLSENGYGVKVSFNENDIKNTTAKLSNHAKKYVPNDSDSSSEQYKKVKVIDNNTTIQYKNLIKGMTLEYVLSSNDIKENIIINEKQERYDYSFVYEFTGGLGAVLNDDGTVSLRDQGTCTDVYILPAPYMFDAEGNISENVEYQLTDLGNDKYSLNVIADSSWINDEERAWPVIIDPTMSWVAGYYDTYIDSANPNQNYGSSRDLWVSSSRTPFMKHVNLPSIPDNATISRVILNLSYYYNVSTGNVGVGLYQVTTNWSEYDLTWNSISSTTNGGISTGCLGTVLLQAASSINASSPGSATINVTDLVKSWYAGLPNYGIALKYQGGTNLSVILMSWETGATTRAKYELTYTTEEIPIANGTICFENGQYNKYVQIDDDATISANGAIFELWSDNGQSAQKWHLEYLHNGYYKITSCASGKVITAPSSVDASLTQQNYSVSDNQLWKITKVNGTMYKLSPKSNLSYYMAAGDGIFTSDGRNIEMRRAQSDNKDEWVFVRMYDSTFVAIPEGTGHPHEASFIDIATSLNRRGHVWNRVATSVTATDCISYMTSSKIFYSRSHGGKTSIVLNNESLTVSILDALPTGALSFCDLVLYGACSTAEGEAAAINLVNKTNEKGVRCVIGFSTSVYCEEVNIWATAFFDALTNGKTVEAACYSADEVVERTWNHDISTNTWYIAGANSLILNWGGLS